MFWNKQKGKSCFSVEDRYTVKFNFSHLYTALARFEYMHYLGLHATWRHYDPVPNPVPQDRLTKLRQVLVWIFGSQRDDMPPVVKRQNPDIKRLGEVLDNPEALRLLETRHFLDDAHAATASVDFKFSSSLLGARDNMGVVAANLRAYDGQDTFLLGVAADIKELAETVYGRMQHKSNNSIVG